MQWRDFFDQFEAIAEAPEGVDRLRELVLELAVRGKLVPQDPEDEPASVLLERIEAERKRLEKAGEIRKQKNLPWVSPAERLFQIPPSWEWQRIGSVADVVGGGTPRTSVSEHFAENGIPWLTPADMKHVTGQLVARGRRDLSKQGLRNSSAQLIPAGSVVFSSRAPIGYVAIAANELATNQGFKSSVPILMAMSKFLYWYLKYAGRHMQRQASGTTFKEVSGQFVRTFVIPVPPLPEQHRIVARVDELMELCDALEEKQIHRFTIRKNLRDASLHALAEAETAEELAHAWKRVRERFGDFAHSSEDVDGLREAILQLGVRGWLVPQDPGDEPAEALLARIFEQQMALSKKACKLPPVDSTEKRTELPDGWEWSRWGQLHLGITSGWSPSCEKRPRQSGEWGVLKISAVSWGEFRPDENKALPKSLEPRPSIAVDIGDFLMSRANTAELVGRSVIVKKPAPRLMMSDKILRVHFPFDTVRDYVNFFNLSPMARRYIETKATGTSSSMRNISRKDINMMPVAFPPEAEQHRITSKLNHLLGLCDKLEAQLTEQRSATKALGTAAVRALTG